MYRRISDAEEPRVPGCWAAAGLSRIARRGGWGVARGGMVRRWFSVGAVVVFGLATAAAATAARWTLQPVAGPSGAALDSFSGVACPATLSCTAVGVFDGSGGSMALAEGWDGVSWSVQAIPDDPGAELLGISCVPAGACVAVGNSGSYSAPVPVAERWDGHQWSVQSAPVPSGAIQSGFTAVSCPSGRDCTAVGRYFTGSATYVFGEQWNGHGWSVQHLPVPSAAGNVFLYAVSCSAASACTAVGSGVTGSGRQVSFADRWNGRHWALQRIARPAGARGVDFEAVACPTARACTVVGSYESSAFTSLALAERWNGHRWSVQDIPNPAGESDVFLHAVSCASRSACTAVGSYPGPHHEVSLAERWNGARWSLQHVPQVAGASNDLVGVSCAAANACTAVGSQVSSAVTTILAARYG